MKSKNKLAIIGFILGILLLPLLSLFIRIGINSFTALQMFLLLGVLVISLSGIGLYQIKKTKEQGKILAIIGLIIGGFWLSIGGLARQDLVLRCTQICSYIPTYRTWRIDMPPYEILGPEDKYFSTQKQCTNYCVSMYDDIEQADDIQYFKSLSTRDQINFIKNLSSDAERDMYMPYRNKDFEEILDSMTKKKEAEKGSYIQKFAPDIYQSIKQYEK